MAKLSIKWLNKIEAPRQKEAAINGNSFNNIYILLIIISCLGLPGVAFATKTMIPINYPIGYSLRPIVLTGEQLAPLQGIEPFSIRIYKHKNGNLIPIPFQIDQRDEKQRYVLKEENVEKEVIEFVIDDNDELVFMVADTGLSPYEHKEKDKDLIEVKLSDSQMNMHRWVYIKLNAEPYEAMSRDYYVRYDAENDSIETSSYLMGFNPEQPFILNHLQRKTKKQKWSGNLIDTMKIKHTGKFLHFIEFYRDYNDYRSTLSNIKTGPVRVIRRTKNKIYLFFGLESPEIEMDYIVYNDCFFVDTLIDIPFSIGTFFSDVKIRLTLDWKKQEFTKNMNLYSDNFTNKLFINGEMSTEKKKVSGFKDNNLMIDSQLGLFTASMFVPDDLPINYHNFFLDDISKIEIPENQPGQWGHFGFMTTDWENVEARPYHMQFKVYMTPNK